MNRVVDRKVYEFRGFRLETAQRRLVHDGRTIPLKPKVFDLLLFLVEMRDQLVEKDDLMREIWPNTIVEENNITVSISTLRKVLGDDRAERQIIETVARRGYRFVAQVVEISEKLGARPVERQIATQTASLVADDGPIDSLAVLTQQTPGNNTTVDYLSDGITESITNTLSQLPNLRVLACSTVLRFKGKDVNPLEVGSLLNVRGVMLVRVIQLDEKLIIRSELVKVSDGSQIWGGQYNRTPADLLTIQDEIAKAISESLKIKLSRQELVRLTKRYTDNTEAYHLYLRGRFFWNKYSKEWVLKAIEAFQQAIEIDARYALAYCGLADAYFRLSNLYMAPDEVLPKAKDAALKAVEIDEDLAEAHSSLGLLHVYYDHNWAAAENEFRRSLELSPDLVLSHQRYGSYLTFMGRFDESVKCYEQALELDPFSLQINMNLATTYYLKGEYEVAISHLEKTLELEPNYMPTHFVLACVYLQQGRLTEALEAFQLIYKRDEETYMALGFMGYAHAKAGQRAEAENLLGILKDISLRTYVSSYSMVVINLGLGRLDRVFELLEQLFEERNDWLVWLKVSPELKVLHNDPRYQDLLARVGF
jgi:DNA-binding winged helix-turn-helix (wHTH) protein/tetratricopeptide (TPR) repeat protein